MKFGDKLIALRKKAGLSQEDLAAKLKVSRQSVSKWESNNTYPETDKIVQICNIFDCSMDDLINENVTDLNHMERKNKNSFSITIDSFLGFITKSIDMFASMKFTSGLKCVIELAIVILILMISGMVVVSILTTILMQLFSFVPQDIFNIIESVLNGLLLIIWFIISVIILIYTFKIRYLDYFEKVKGKSKENVPSHTDEKEPITIKNTEQIVIRDPKDQPFAFLSVLSKVVIWCFKFFVMWIALGFVFTLVALIVSFVVVLPLSICSMIFCGAEIGLFGAIVINVLVVLFLIYFIMNKKVNIKVFTIVFIGALFVLSIGIGISVLGFKNVEVKDETFILEKKPYHTELTYYDNLLLIDGHDQYELVVDDSMPLDHIIMSTYYDAKLSEIVPVKTQFYGMDQYRLDYNNKQMNFKLLYDTFIKDLKNNVIRNYSWSSSSIEIKASNETIQKILNNAAKVYFFDQEKTENGLLIDNIEFRIDEDTNYCDATYNAFTDQIEVDSSDCVCSRQDVTTSRGVKVSYSCSFKDDVTEE